MSACKKELNVLPTTSQVDGNVITDATSASTVLNGVYYRFAASGVDNNNVPTILWSDPNEGLPSVLAGTMVSTITGNAFGVHNYISTSPFVDRIWTYGYGLVNAANGFLKNVAPVNSIAAAKKTQMIAEAKFLRAYGDSELLLYYGQYNDISSANGILLRTEFVDVSNINLPRATVKASYDAIIADLDDAIAGLPALNTDIWYANVSAAKLLKARVLINRNAGGDMASVISLTNDVITSSSFTLESNVKDIFWSKALTSNEVILGVKPYTAPQQDYKYQNYLYFNQYYGSDSLVSLLKNDPRNTWLYQYRSSTSYGTIASFTKYYPGVFPVTVANPITENSYAFRLTEAYLLEAEALVTSGGDQAKARTLLETVMSHAGLTDFSAVEAEHTNAGLQLLIAKESMKNFIGEAGQDWLALRRLPFATVKAMVPSLTAQSLLILPVPEAEITSNSKMTQNPGY